MEAIRVTLPSSIHSNRLCCCFLFRYWISCQAIVIESAEEAKKLDFSKSIRLFSQTTGMVAEGLVRFAMAALLEYLHDTQIKGVERLKTVITYNEAQFMRCLLYTSDTAQRRHALRP